MFRGGRKREEDPTKDFVVDKMNINISSLLPKLCQIVTSDEGGPEIGTKLKNISDGVRFFLRERDLEER
jgi:hypothetical protein